MFDIVLVIITNYEFPADESTRTQRQQQTLVMMMTHQAQAQNPAQALVAQAHASNQPPPEQPPQALQQQQQPPQALQQQQQPPQALQQQQQPRSGQPQPKPASAENEGLFVLLVLHNY
jgi:hypothetical protein